MEGYHGGVIRTLLYYAQDMPSPYNIPVHEVVQQLALVRGKVGAGNGYGILNEGYHGNGSMVVAADHKGMGYIRQPHQARIFCSAASSPCPQAPPGTKGPIQACIYDMISSGILLCTMHAHHLASCPCIPDVKMPICLSAWTAINVLLLLCILMLPDFVFSSACSRPALRRWSPSTRSALAAAVEASFQMA